MGPFQDISDTNGVDLKVTHNKLQYPRDTGRLVQGTFIMGMDIMQDCEDDDMRTSSNLLDR